MMAASLSAPSPGAPPQLGEPLPLFTLPDTAGHPVRLWDFKQRRPVVLLFIHGPGCGSCRQALAALAARQADLEELHTAVLVIARDTAESLGQLRAELASPFTFLADTDAAVTARYLPQTAGVNASGVVALYVADRYGVCGLAATAPDAGALPNADAILAELAHLDEDTCACLVPAWPDEPRV